MSERNFRWRWSNVDASDRADEYVELLNQLRPDDDPARFPNTLAWIAPQPNERILEVGCGNGAVARAVANYQPDIREVVAVDASAVMIAAARQAIAGRALPVTYAVADAQQLPFPDGAFDRSYAQELFVILPDPEQALRELARVTRPGGQMRVWESDVDTHAMLGPDVALARRFMRYVGDVEYNGAIARQLIGWLKAWGWQVTATPAVNVSTAESPTHAALMREWLADAQTANVITTAEADSLVADYQRRLQAGTYFAYLVNFRIAATKPAT
jgi:SAM-dependent methyltransferase